MAQYQKKKEFSSADKDRYKTAIEAVKNATNVNQLLDVYGVDYSSTVHENKFRSACPIHGGDRRDAFIFDNDRKSYKCFTKGCTGDVFQFVMELDHCSFNVAVKKLAEMAGVDIKNWSDRDVYETKYESFIDKAQKFKETIKKRKDEMENGGNIYRDVDELKDYIPLPDFCSEKSRRNLNLETIKDFDIRLGRMKEDPYKHLRIIVPIHDEFGNYIGQVGRTWYECDRAKYWYTPSGIAKSLFVFNGNRAKKHVMDYDSEMSTMFVCEGTFDVLKLWQLGYKNTVAIFGSDPSEDQIRIMSGMADRFILCFDDDESGYGATKKFVHTVSNMSINAEICVFYISVGKKDVGNMSEFQIKQSLENLMTYEQWVRRLKERIDIL